MVLDDVDVDVDDGSMGVVDGSVPPRLIVDLSLFTIAVATPPRIILTN